MHWSACDIESDLRSGCACHAAWLLRICTLEICRQSSWWRIVLPFLSIRLMQYRSWRIKCGRHPFFWGFVCASEVWIHGGHTWQIRLVVPSGDHSRMARLQVSIVQPASCCFYARLFCSVPIVLRGMIELCKPSCICTVFSLHSTARSIVNSPSHFFIPIFYLL